MLSGRSLEQPQGVGPGQLFAEPALRMACDDAGDGVGEQGLRVDAVEPQRLASYSVGASVLGDLSSVAFASRPAKRLLNLEGPKIGRLLEARRRQRSAMALATAAQIVQNLHINRIDRTLFCTSSHRGLGMSATIINLIIQLISGAAGGNVIGSMLKNMSLGPLGNSIAGAVGGAAGGTLLGSLIPGLAGGGGFDLGQIAGQLAGGGVTGAIVTAVVGFLVNAFKNKA